MPPGGEAVIRLTGIDLDGDELVATVASLPESGTLYQVGEHISMRCAGKRSYHRVGQHTQRGGMVWTGGLISDIL